MTIRPAAPRQLVSPLGRELLFTDSPLMLDPRPASVIASVAATIDR
jgi:hypothetical protein